MAARYAEGQRGKQWNASAIGSMPAALGRDQEPRRRNKR